MATIEMDVSEWEAMKKVERLLEESLNTERGLKEEIVKLNQDKIDDLENSKMRVVKIVKHERKEIMLIRRDSDQIWHFICNRLGLDINAVNKARYRNDTRNRMNSMHGFDMNSFGSLEDELISAFFRKEESITYPDAVETTVHGLDQIKLELKGEIEAAFSSDHLKLLAEAKVAMTERASLIKDIKRLDTSAGTLKKANDKFIKINGLQITEIEELKKEHVKKLDSSGKHSLFYDNVYDLLKDGYGTFGRGTLLEGVIDQIRIANKKE